MRGWSKGAKVIFKFIQKMKFKINSLKSIIFNNKSVIENYFFMTILHPNSFLSLNIPIPDKSFREWGIWYICICNFCSYLFFIFYQFRVRFTSATKAIAENAENRYNQRNILSCIFTSKSYLFIISSLVFGILLFTVLLWKK